MTCFEVLGSRPRQAQLRPTKQLPYELSNHAKAYLEGGQFETAYDFLLSLLDAGLSISSPAQPYVGYLSPHTYIGLASSLVVYPNITSKAKTADLIRGSDSALRYLRRVQSTVDEPAYPSIREAFRITGERDRRRTQGYRNAGGVESPDLSGDVEKIAGAAANAQCLWNRAEDFWHIVGWAFNCSIAHDGRWNRWKLWLETILDFLEADWAICNKKYKGDTKQREKCFQETLLWHYVVGNSGQVTRQMRRRIVKAILAASTADSYNHFGEIWEKETVDSKRKQTEGQPVAKVDFETGEIGDYNSDEEMQGASAMLDGTLEEDEEGLHFMDFEDIENLHDAFDRMGGVASIELRQRFLALLTQVAVELPNHFTTLDDFFDNILEGFTELPTSIFEVLVSTSTMPGLFQLAFNNNLLVPLVSGRVPNFFELEPTQQDLETMLLPLRATSQSFAPNAKISLILEQIFLYMLSIDALTCSESLEQALTKGLEARAGVYGSGRGKKGNSREEEQAKAILDLSAQRLKSLFVLLKSPVDTRSQPNNGTTGHSTILSFGSSSQLSPPPDSDEMEE